MRCKKNAPRWAKTRLEIHLESGVLEVFYKAKDYGKTFRHWCEAVSRPEVLGAEISEWRNRAWRSVEFE